MKASKKASKDYRLLVFDWDGTLMDSTAKIVRCFAGAAADAGAPYPGDPAVRDIIGLGLAEAMDALFPTADADQRAVLLDRYREHFLYLDRTPMEFFPGVARGLRRLDRAGYILAVATGKARRGLRRVLAQTGSGHLFAVTRCADETMSKPHPQMLLDILAATGTRREQALMVGDTVHDMRMAAQAGVDALAVSYGAQGPVTLAAEEPLACMHSFDELCRWLER